jgi:hypothetical protein
MDAVKAEWLEYLTTIAMFLVIMWVAWVVFDAYYGEFFGVAAIRRRLINTLGPYSSLANRRP